MYSISFGKKDWRSIKNFAYKDTLYFRRLSVCKKEERTCSQILSPWLGDKVDSGTGLWYRPACLRSVAGRYDIPMPLSGAMNLSIVHNCEAVKWASFVHKEGCKDDIRRLLHWNSPDILHKYKEAHRTLSFKKSLFKNLCLKVHNHEIFFLTFFSETETIWSQGPVTRDF